MAADGPAGGEFFGLHLDVALVVQQRRALRQPPLVAGCSQSSTASRADGAHGWSRCEATTCTGCRMITTTVADGNSSSRNGTDSKLNGVFSHHVRFPARLAAAPNKPSVNSWRTPISSARSAK